MTLLSLRQQLSSWAVFIEARRRCILESAAIYEALLHWAPTLRWEAWGEQSSR
jgi:hypothetical protein